MNYKKLTQKIIIWLRKQVKNANAKGVVIGLSGGVDSAVVSVLCKKSFPDSTLALILPCGKQNESVNLAVKVAKLFNINYSIIDLTNIFLNFCDLFQLNPESNDISVVNIKPRLRMITLYHYANKLNYLVVGTANKCELMTGYFTKYGDGGVDILPIGGLVKSQVLKLGKYLGIPEEVISRPPSAELWNGQTDENELGIKYKYLDKIFLSKSVPPKNISPKIFNKVQKMVLLSQHKRKFPPIFNI